MMAPWMAYTVVVSILLGLGGAVAEGVLRALGRPGRWGVVAGILASLAVSVAAFVAPGQFFLSSTAVADLLAGTLEEPVFGPVGSLVEMTNGPEAWNFLDTPILISWMLASLVVILVGIYMQRRLVHSVLRCSLEEVGGVEVRRTRHLGPAVVGCLKGIIVLPEWTCALGPRAIELSVSHEKEHLRARDPVLLFAAYLLVALQPWNPFLWWQISRLKRAIEADCDRRVLDRGVDPRAYASLLLKLASRRGWSPPFALPLRKGRSRVGKRIALMADSLGRPRTGTAALGSLLVVSLLGVGLLIPVPNAGRRSAGPATVRVFTSSAHQLLAERTGGNELAEAIRSASTNPGAATPVAHLPKVVRGDDALLLLGQLRELSVMVPGPDANVELRLEEGEFIRVSNPGTSPDPTITLIRRGQLDVSAPSRRISMALDIEEGELVFTFARLLP